MLKIKVIGSGSAGNHIAYAFRNLSNSITMTDKDLKSLKISKREIYQNRYKNWNKNISLKLENLDNDNYDLIIISSPPNTHLKLLKKNIKNSNLFMIEKPLCEPNLKSINEFEKLVEMHKNKIFLCGYNHRLFPSTQKIIEIIKKNKLRKNIHTIEVNFKENTSGFLKAHKWFNSLADSYLSKTVLGGGSLLEHSHALNLGQFLLDDNLKQIKMLKSNINFLKSKNEYYDYDTKLDFMSGSKLIRIQQNFTTLPVEKNIRVLGKDFDIELIYNYKNNDDKIIYIDKKSKKIKNFHFKKTRADDFLYEAVFLKKVFLNKNKNNILSIQNALNTMKLILSAFKKAN